MSFTIDDLEETLGLQEVEYDQDGLFEDEFADELEDEMEEQFEDMMMLGSTSLFEGMYIEANGDVFERTITIMSGGMKFVYQAEPELAFRLFDSEEQSLFTMNYYWNDMVSK